MREILFRGKQDSNGKWVYGDYHTDSCYIYDCKDSIAYKVIAETVGQFTGLCDKNGKKIFEGDIVRCKNYHGTVEGYIGYSKSGVYFLYCISGYSDEYLFNCTDIEIIGNIYDNPELLKGDDKTE